MRRLTIQTVLPLVAFVVFCLALGSTAEAREKRGRRASSASSHSRGSASRAQPRSHQVKKKATGKRHSVKKRWKARGARAVHAPQRGRRGGVARHQALHPRHGYRRAVVSHGHGHHDVYVHGGGVAYVEPVVVSEPAPRRAIDNGWGPSLAIGIRPSAIMFEGEKLSLSRLENPTMSGLGLLVRGDVAPGFSVELSFDYLRSRLAYDGDMAYRQTTVPVMLSALFYLFPYSRVNPYVVAGGGVHVTTLSYYNGALEHELWEPAAQLGGGVRVRLTDSLEIFGDVRSVAVEKDLNAVSEARSDCIAGWGSGNCQLKPYDPGDKFNIGAQFSAGLAFRF